MTARTRTPRLRLRLRTRVTVAFAVGALLLSATLAGLTYELARTYLLRQRERSVLRQTSTNAALVRRSLDVPAADVPRVLDSLDLRTGSHPVVYSNGRWFAASLAVGRDAIPAALRDEVLGGRAAHQRVVVRGEPEAVVGVPLPGADAAYFEVFPMNEVAGTLRTLQSSLLVAAAVTTLAGAAVGRSVSRTVLAPVHDVAEAAVQVADGNFDATVDAGGDSDLAVMTDAFNRMTEALRERIRRDARFAAAVTHELRSPLMALASAMQVVVARRDEMPERARRAVDLLATEVGRFQRLAEDMLEVSRLDAGAAEPVWEEVRFGEFLLHAVEGRTPPPPVELDDAAGEARVRVDKRRLERAIANLVDNADRYAGGVTNMTAERDGTKIRVAVDDAGPGVAPAERAHIFERFVRGTQRSGDRAGSGLGLALVDEYVRLHGGCVRVEDSPAGGARFVVELPAVDGA